MTITCPQCGKKRYVPYPDLWVYRREGKYLCSYGCMRAWDKEHFNGLTYYKGDVTKVTKEEKQTALDIALQGGNPLAYLIRLGKRDPQNVWYQIKSEAKKANPEIVEQLPKKLPTLKESMIEAYGEKKEPEEKPKADKGMPKALELEGGVNYQLSVAETPEAPKITQPLMHSGKKAIGWEGDFGNYIYDRKHGYIDYESNDGEEISMPVDAWRKWLKEIGEIAQLMGVEL